jgi:hypothetical protein
MTNNKQQTAVEWFAKKVMHLDWKFSNQKEKEKIIQQAKEMEKKQIILSIAKNLPIEDGVLTAVQKAELYYEKTYGYDKQ